MMMMLLPGPYMYTPLPRQQLGLGANTVVDPGTGGYPGEHGPIRPTIFFVLQKPILGQIGQLM